MRILAFFAAMELKGIKNIIFDLGGVLLNIDYQLTIDAFYELGISREQLEYSQKEQSDLFDGLETGTISPDTFRDGVRELSYLGLSDDEIDTAWNALLLDMPQHRVELLEKLKDQYNIFLLSNTNEIHYKDYSEKLQLNNGIPNLEHLFQKTYLSHVIGKRKPDPATFEWVCKDAGINPEETLFIDDSHQHIEGAKSIGLNTHWLEKGDVKDLF